MNEESEIRALYQALIDGWNSRNAQNMAAVIAEDGDMIGFDGSQMHGRSEITTTLTSIFADHPTGRYLSKVRSIRFLGDGAAILRAVVGMIPAGHSDLKPELNAHQTLVAARPDGTWRVVLFQNTPAQFHGRPDLVESLTDELRQLLKAHL